MRINSIRPTSFKAVTPIIMEKGTIRDLERALEKRTDHGYYLQNATYQYEKAAGPMDNKAQLRKAVNQGKEVGFLVTGEDYGDMLFGKYDWHSEYAPSRHMNDDVTRIDEITEEVLAKLINLINNYI